VIRVIGSLLITSQGTQRGVLEVFQPRALRVHCHFTLAHLIIDNRDTVEGSPSITTSLSEQSQILPTEHDEGLNYLEKLQRDWIRAQRPADPRHVIRVALEEQDAHYCLSKVSSCDKISGAFTNASQRLPARDAGRLPDACIVTSPYLTCIGEDASGDYRVPLVCVGRALALHLSSPHCRKTCEISSLRFRDTDVFCITGALSLHLSSPHCRKKCKIGRFDLRDVDVSQWRPLPVHCYFTLTRLAVETVQNW